MADRLSWIFHVDSVPMTKAVVAGQTSLGGSESACLGLARALKARGHDVTVAATKMSDDVPEYDHAGVRWIPSETLPTAQKLIDPDVFVALRQPGVFSLPVQARYRMLWNQDMLVGDGPMKYTMSLAWAYDAVAYVSEYQRKQWEGLAPDLKSLGWVTRNGFDPAMVPTDVERVPNRIIHISRPERAMSPILAMWPELKRRVPDAELHVCRYQSMYDGEGSNVKAMVEAYDAEIARVNAEVGGIVQLGQLNKRDLYRAIASASVMWYPGVVDFAETSCIAAIEAQACGTPLVLSYKGALPETAPYAWHVHGDAMSDSYQAQSIDLVASVLNPVVRDISTIVSARHNGLAHVQSYTYDAIAADWEAHVWGAFDARSSARPDRVVAALLHEDDHVAAKALTTDPAIIAECDRVIRGEAQTDIEYGKFALSPKFEIERKTTRHDIVVEAFAGKKHILDLACGNGAFAILLAEADPERHVTGYDYSQQNIDAAIAEAKERGLSDRVTFERRVVCNLESGAVQLEGVPQTFDGVFAGEFCEHIGGIETFLDDTHRMVGPGVSVVITVPSGPFSELLPVDMPKQKGHVHHFRPRDIDAIWGRQENFTADYLDCGFSPRSAPIGHWIIRYVTSDRPVGRRPLSHWHRTMRPKAGLSVGILAHNATKWLNNCLTSVYQIADQVIIADCASEDRQELEHIAERFKAVLVNLPPVAQLEGGFAQARNITLGVASEDWFLWIDTDEELVGNQCIAKYLESGPFRGYAVKQNHLMLDCPSHFDTPVRLFKRGDDIEFYGCVHEQPQQGDCNGDVTPALQLFDAQIAHLGYLHEGIRRHKSTKRNLPLLLRDRKVYPERRLGLVLWLRDYVTHANWMLEANGGKQTPTILEFWGKAVTLFEAHFADPADKFHAIARPFYEQAVKHIRGAIEVETSLGGAVQGLRGHRAESKRFWVRTPSQIKPLLDHYQREALSVYEAKPVDVEPWVPARDEVTA